MKQDESDLKGMISLAEKLGQEVAELEERNKRRRAKGRKPLPDIQSKKDEEVLKTQYRTGDYTTVDGAQALALYEKRKAMMIPDDDDDDDDEEEPAKPRSKAHEEPKEIVHPADATENVDDEVVSRAIKEAEAARRIQDMKAGRIDHESNWSKDGQRLEGGDETSLPKTPEKNEEPVKEDSKKPAKTKRQSVAGYVSKDEFNARMDDLYARLATSFDGLETTMSDLQGRVAEIVTATTPKEAPLEKEGGDEFSKLLDHKTPVTFDVGGTQMVFDAITVFHAPPCITVVSKIGSAKIMPKPGARLFLTYEMDGRGYEKDPVTFLGTRFDLPMFGLSFVGFIRDVESDMMDVDAEEARNPGNISEA